MASQLVLVLATLCTIVLTFEKLKASVQPQINQLDAYDTELCGQSVGPLSDNGARQLITIKQGQTASGQVFEVGSRLLRRANQSHTSIGLKRRLHPSFWYNKTRLWGQTWGVYPGETPWYVSLQTYFLHHGHIRRPRCAGTLIHKNLILTAAHCLRRGKYNATYDSYALGGIYNWRKNETVQKVKFKRYCLPQKYKPSWSRNVTSEGYDFALIELERDFNYTRFLLPACLYNLTAKKDASITTNCKAIGLGHQVAGYRPGPVGLHFTRLCEKQEEKRHRPDELCFVRAAKGKLDNRFDIVDRGSGAFCHHPQTGLAYLLGPSTVNMQPSEKTGENKPEQTYYTNLFRWRREILEMFRDCLQYVL